MLIAVIAFAAMEPVTAAAHRWIMHGVGEVLHRSHHRRSSGRVEANDWYPVMFAALVNVGFYVGFNVDGLASLVEVGLGITAYGAAYGLVHDVYIHRRIRGGSGPRIEPLERLAEAHRIHHLYNAAPYGMLLPIVPAGLRERAERTDRDPLVRTA